MRLIVTRPEPDAWRTAQALAALGHDAIVSPMLDISPVLDRPLPNQEFQAVLATSSNAVRALALHPGRGALMFLPLLAVGDRTALEAKRAGFEAARSAGGALNDLLALVGELHPAKGPLLYISGDVQSDDLAGLLRAKGFAVQTAILYRATARRRLAPSASAALRGGSADGVLLYSRRSAAAFARALRAEGLAPLPQLFACFCLSTSVAEPLAEISTGPVLVAARPEQISLFALFERCGGVPAGRQKSI